jgi:hypothetical protein
MIAGIDNSKYYLVFLTARFIIKVAGDNAADNCRKEFKYAALKNKIFIAVVMEEGVRDQRAWPSIIGLHLGSRLYIDAAGDLTNPEYMNQVVDEIRKAARLLDAGAAIPATIAGATHPTTVFTGSASTKLLQSLTVAEVEALFDALNLGAYKNVVAVNALDGATLAFCTSVEDFVSMGITLRPKAALLLSKVDDYKAAGVPLSLLTPTSTHLKAGQPMKATTAAATKPTVTSSSPSKIEPTTATKVPSKIEPTTATKVPSKIEPTTATKVPAIAAIKTTAGLPDPTAFLKAAKVGNLEAIRTCLNNHTDIESKSEYNQTAVSLASEKGHVEAIKVLLDRGANIGAKDKLGWTSLHYASANGHTEVIKLLLDRGAKIEAKRNDGDTPLIRAVVSGRIETINLLLDRGANIGVKNNAGETLLHKAIFLDNEVKELLRARGAK